jgi:DinB superfamily
VTPSLQKSFDRLERQRSQVLGMLKNLPEEKFHVAPTGKWMVAQIITHLITSETLSLGYMRKKSLGIDGLKDSGLKQVVVFWLLKISQRIPVRYKAPKAVVENTPSAFSKDELLSRWDNSRRELNNFLNTIPDNYSRRLIFKHPVAGMLDARQTVGFMYEHVLHHLPQIKRLLKR